MHTDHTGKLRLDKEQSYDVLGVHTRHGYVTLTFSRKYDTCDDDDYMIDVSSL